VDTIFSCCDDFSTEAPDAPPPRSPANADWTANPATIPATTSNFDIVFILLSYATHHLLTFRLCGLTASILNDSFTGLQVESTFFKNGYFKVNTDNFRGNYEAELQGRSLPESSFKVILIKP
jgi:hypothetical protein